MLPLLRRLSLTHWILISMAIGTLIGWAFPDPHWSGTVTAVKGNEVEVTQQTGVGKEKKTARFRADEEQRARHWEGVDLSRNKSVRLKIEKPVARPDAKPETKKTPFVDDIVRVEYETFSAGDLKPLSTIFLRMIKSLIAPLIFATLIIGIA